TQNTTTSKRHAALTPGRIRVEFRTAEVHGSTRNTTTRRAPDSAVIVPGRSSGKVHRSALDLAGPDQTFPDHHRFEGGEPAPVVAPRLLGPLLLGGGDGRDELLTERLPCERPAGMQGHRQAERRALPGLGEDQFAIPAGRRRRSVDVEHAG